MLLLTACCRFVLADTEKLHDKIAVMSDRIRLLEDALAIVQSTVTSEPHPLLSRDQLNIKSSLELHSAVEGEEKTAKVEAEEGEETTYIDAFGTLAIRDDGAATFYGRSAGSEVRPYRSGTLQRMLIPVSRTTPSPF